MFTNGLQCAAPVPAQPLHPLRLLVRHTKLANTHINSCPYAWELLSDVKSRVDENVDVHGVQDGQSKGEVEEEGVEWGEAVGGGEGTLRTIHF